MNNIIVFYKACNCNLSQQIYKCKIDIKSFGYIKLFYTH